MRELPDRTTLPFQRYVTLMRPRFAPADSRPARESGLAHVNA